MVELPKKGREDRQGRPVAVCQGDRVGHGQVDQLARSATTSRRSSPPRAPSNEQAEHPRKRRTGHGPARPFPKETTMASVLAERLSRGIAWACAAILYLTFGAIFFILCSDVILRYFAGSSLRWASEIPELLFPWLVMAGVVLAAQHGAHIATTFLADAVHGTARRVIASRRACRRSSPPTACWPWSPRRRSRSSPTSGPPILRRARIRHLHLPVRRLRADRTGPPRRAAALGRASSHEQVTGAF